MAIRTGRLGQDDSLSGTSSPDYLFGGLNRGIYYRSLTDDDVEKILADHEDEFLEAGYTEEQWNAFRERTLYTFRNDWTAGSVVQPAELPEGGGWYRELFSDVERFHPGADKDFRRVVGEVQLGDTGQTARYGQQATYDDDDRLITHGPGAGTPDLQAPGRVRDNLPGSDTGNVSLHTEWDVTPHNVLGWRLYHQLGWSPHREWSPEAAAEYWGQDGNDTLRGGTERIRMASLQGAKGISFAITGRLTR